MAGENDKQPTASELFAEGYAKTFEKHQRDEKERQVFKVELNELEHEHASAVYKMARWYEQKAKQEQNKG